MWNAEARKLLALIYWMVTEVQRLPRERDDGSSNSSPSVVLELLLSRIAPANSDKSEQMAAALVVFELIQLQQQRVREAGDDDDSAGAALLGREHSDKFVEALVQLVRLGSIASTVNSHAPGSAGSDRFKLTMLGHVALEALIAVLCDRAAWFLSGASGERTNSEMDAASESLVLGAGVAVSTLQRYHSSPRKLFLVLALRQLNEYVVVCRTLQASRASSADAASFSSALEMLCWHWTASAMLLCSRSDAVMRVKKTKPRVALRAAIRQWQRSSSNSVRLTCPTGAAGLLAARVRQVWLLLNSVGTGKVTAVQVLVEEELETKGALLVLLVRALRLSIRWRDATLVGSIATTLKALVLDGERNEQPATALQHTTLVESDEECCTFLVLLLRAFKSGIEAFGSPAFILDRELVVLRELLAAFIVGHNLVLSSEFLGYLESPDSGSVQVRCRMRSTHSVFTMPAVTKFADLVRCRTDCAAPRSSYHRPSGERRCLPTEHSQLLEVRTLRISQTTPRSCCVPSPY